MDLLNIDGIWKGEYVTHWFPYSTGREVAVPFVMRIQAEKETRKNTHYDDFLFAGICQDDPEISKINFHASVSGAVSLHRVFLIKQYPKLIIRNSSDHIETYDELLHPEIIYKGVFDRNEFSGTWNMNRTFRKINGKVCELMPMNGAWWMKKYDGI